MKGTSQERQAWLEGATFYLRELINSKGFFVPENVRVSVGWPKGGRGAVIGQCWYDVNSGDKAHELFISPAIEETMQVLATLAHELCHTSAGVGTKHGPEFRKRAVGIGLTGKMTATIAGDDFKAWAAKECLPFVGDYPHGQLASVGERAHPKAGTRLLKAECPCCGYTIRLSQKWVDAGLPICPQDEEQFTLA